jgi:hypothetical protein
MFKLKLIILKQGTDNLLNSELVVLEKFVIVCLLCVLCQLAQIYHFYWLPFCFVLVVHLKLTEAQCHNYIKHCNTLVRSMFKSIYFMIC